MDSVPRRTSFAAKPSFLALAGFAVLCAGIVFSLAILRQDDSFFRETLLKRAVTTASSIPVERIRALKGQLSDEARPEYRILKTQLRAIAGIDSDWRWTYLMGRRPDGVLFDFVDSLEEDDPDLSRPGDPYAEATEILQASFESLLPRTDGPYRDHRGSWTRAYVPILDPVDGSLVALFGIDVSAETWGWKMLRAATAPAILAFLLLALVIAYVHIAASSRDAPPRQNRMCEVVLVVLLGTLVTGSMAWMAWRMDRLHQQEVLENLAQERSEHIHVALRSLQWEQLEGVARFFASSEEVTESEFNLFVSPLLGLPKAQCWAWVPAPGETEVPARHTILYSQALPGSDRFIRYAPGTQLGTDNHVRRTFEAARDSRLAVTTDPLAAFAARPDEPHILAVRAVFDAESPDSLLGYVVAVIEPDRFLRSVRGLRHNSDGLLRIDLLQIRPGSNAVWLAKCDRTPDEPLDLPEVLLGKSRFQITRPILAFDKVYGVATQATPALLAGNSNPLFWFILLLGFLATAAAARAVGRTAVRQTDLEKLVGNRTLALRESVQRYEQLARFSRTFSWETDSSGLYRRIDGAVREVLGYTPEELVGKMYYFDLFPETERDDLRQAVEQHAATGEEMSGFINPLVTKDGRTLWVSSNGIPILNAVGALTGYHGTDTDVTETVLARKSVQESDQRYQMLTETMQDVVLVLNAETLGFLYVSPNVESLLGYKADEIAGGTLDALILPDKELPLKEHIRERLDAFRQGRLSSRKFFLNEVDQRHKDGHPVQTEMVIRFWRNPKNDTLELHAVCRGISDRKRTQTYRDLSVATLQILNQPDSFDVLLQRVTDRLAEKTGLEGVGIRLKANDDYPFAAASGCSCELMHNGSGLALRDADGRLVLDEQGVPQLHCLCGKVLRGETYTNFSGLSEGGSCWSSNARELLDHSGAHEAPPSCQVNRGGSFALIPVKSKNMILGLLQLQDNREGMFTSEIIDILEGIATHIGTSLQRKQAERDYRMLFHGMLEGFAVHELLTDEHGKPVDYRILAANPAFERLTGYKASEIVGKTIRDLQPGIEPAWIERYGAVALNGKPAFFQDYSSALGRHFEVAAFRSGPRQFACLFTDITERVRADEAQRESRRQYLSLLSNLPGMAYRCRNDSDWTMDFVSEGARNLTGFNPEEIVGNDRISYNMLIMPKDRDWLWDRWQEAIRTRSVFEAEYEIVTRDRRVKWVWERGAAVYDGQGNAVALEGFISDITERKLATAELAESEFRFRTLADSGQTLIWTSTPDKKRDWFNRPWLEFTGRTPEQEQGDGWVQGIHPEDVDHCVQTYAAAFDRRDSFGLEYRIRHASGGFRWIVERATPRVDLAGEFLGYIGHCMDITDRKLAEEEREKLQEQFTQSQKMESIGRLAGGVAHDFNNMLQAILGYTEMALEDVPADQPLHADLNEILKAARRSAALTGQLQAFARKQTITPKVINLNESVDSLINMLRRLIGEEIELAWHPGRSLHTVLVDPGQFDQVVANLCINARDAIGSKGRIVLKTANVRVDSPDVDIHREIVPGDYVMLSVADSGGGIAPELVRQIFEPFFTTKARGAGTGLGLSTVYGIVRQNKGGIQVLSPPDKGATFNIFFPRHTGTETGAAAEAKRDLERGQGETILLVEDEELIIQTARRMLESLGYKVLATMDSQKALTLMDDHAAEIRLVLSDVIMPHLNGPEMVQKILARHPDMKALFMSGYTANLLAKQGFSSSSVNFVQKPFSRPVLAKAVYDALQRGK